jgi:hypothetical protein
VHESTEQLKEPSFCEIESDMNMGEEYRKASSLIMTNIKRRRFISEGEPASETQDETPPSATAFLILTPYTSRRKHVL